jgi:hypothetical protein
MFFRFLRDLCFKIRQARELRKPLRRFKGDLKGGQIQRGMFNRVELDGCEDIEIAHNYFWGG